MRCNLETKKLMLDAVRYKFKNVKLVIDATRCKIKNTKLVTDAVRYEFFFVKRSDFLFFFC